MNKRVMAMLAGVVALAVFVGGCGGGGDEEETLTKAQYVKQGSKICAKEGEKMGDDLTAYGKKHDLSNSKVSEEETAKVMEAVIFPGFEAEIEGLQELPPPEGEEEKVEAMVADFESGLEKGAEDPANFFANENSEFGKATDALEKYGVKGCGTLFL